MVRYVVTSWNMKTNEKFRQNAKTKKDAIRIAKKFESKGLQEILIMKYSKTGFILDTQDIDTIF